MEQQYKLPIDPFYNGRQSFTIIGLTGVAGSGCSKLAEYMSSKGFLSKVRKPEDILEIEAPELDNEKNFQNDQQNVNNKALGSLVFKRKYTICYDFAQKHYQDFIVIKYTHIVWLYTMLYIVQTSKAGISLAQGIERVLRDKYKPSIHSRDAGYKSLIGYSETSRYDFISGWINNHHKEIDVLEQEIKNLPRHYLDNLDDSKSDRNVLVTFFKKDSTFDRFVTEMFKAMGEEDCYSLCFLHHRLAGQIRKSGNPLIPFADDLDNHSGDYRNLFNLIRLLNIIVKGYKDEGNGRVVIDSLRNSIEAKYLKERYTAFYLIAVSDTKSHEANIEKNICQRMPKAKNNEDLLCAVIDKVRQLSSYEVKSEDYVKGIFYSPDIENVVADAEIHISNNYDEAELPDNKICEFASMAEQWMKYSSLILHPGLITPSADERCMVVAYTAKFNSTCLSRQVGAVITNQYHSIRTIGWNEVPYGQVPCGLRNLNLIGGKCENPKCMYSDFERGPHSHYEGSSFAERVKHDYPHLEDDSKNTDALPYPYCFKTLHNRYEGEKNQVFTRSLHAEENAILQMAKYGGEALMNGIIYVTASPCELCSKKLYQIGVRKIVYIDPYPGIARTQIIGAGFKRPQLKIFQGAFGSTYYKLYQPFMSLKDELAIRTGDQHKIKTGNELLKEILKKLGIDSQKSYTEDEVKDILRSIKTQSDFSIKSIWKDIIGIFNR